MANWEPILLLNAPPEPLDLSRIGSGQVLEQDPWLQTHDRVHTKHCALGLRLCVLLLLLRRTSEVAEAGVHLVS